jgi:hypothetical protein
MELDQPRDACFGALLLRERIRSHVRLVTTGPSLHVTALIFRKRLVLQWVKSERLRCTTNVRCW